ncbi:unnamed protein product [Effrenium voratum]|uniref:LicD/FKTN/FKRP nucleotidyltransferase domain-containing protein n=1 Tax=Effrenium voratum TaxID=2562239 RepID=A0AA36HRJ4_9DINO|nr:unnamed protein product [Effrenium voratum]CAJ1450384.1 unnamed protein product [Effrenium voratum]
MLMPWCRVAGCWFLVRAATLGDYFDSFRDEYGYTGGYMGGYSGFGDYKRGGSYDDDFGSPYGTFGGGIGQADRKELGKDDCSRIEADGIPLAELLREAAENLPQNLSEIPMQVQELVGFFSGQDHRRFLMSHCPQAVALAVLLQAEAEAASVPAPGQVTGLAEGPLKRAVLELADMLQAAPTLRGPFKAPPVWTGEPWGAALSAAQRRTGVVLFPIGEQQFHVDFVPATNWSIWANRRCRGRRDLGNLQGTPLATCLDKCLSHPSCRSATFWHWQPGGMGFDQRCFLSSSCTSQLSTDEGAEGAFLFEKLAVLTPGEKEIVQDTLRSAGAAWAPRAGHRLLAAPAETGVRLWLMGGVGVDPFDNATQEEKKSPSPPSNQDKRARKKGGKGGKGSVARDPKSQRRNHTGMLNVVQAYLSRHVELSGELPPLRSLPYGRLGDIWCSDDEGSSWTLVQQSAPWGPRAYFGAVAAGRGLLVFGGIITQAVQNASQDSLARAYVNDVWYTDLQNLAWQELPRARWEARAAFQALTWQPSGHEEVILLGGRLDDGTLKNDVWALLLDVDRLTSSEWRLVTASAAWSARSDFAATSTSEPRLWVLGGTDQAGRALADVWFSGDGVAWTQARAVSAWGPRIGATAVTLRVEASQVILLFGGYSYPDEGFGPLLGNTSDVWKEPAWLSADGQSWWPLEPDRLAWTQGTMHAAVAAAPCDARQPEGGWACGYVTGGLSDEGYYDNTVRRLRLGAREAALLDSGVAPGPQSPPDADAADAADASLAASALPAGVGRTEKALWSLGVVAFVVLAGISDSYRKKIAEADPSLRGLVDTLRRMLLVLFMMALVTGAALSRLSDQIAMLQPESSKCQIDSSELWHKLGLAEQSARWDQFEILLRLAARESQYGYGFGYGGKASDLYGGHDRGSNFPYPYGHADAVADVGPGDTRTAKEPNLKKELSALPTIQSVSCRTPKCDRNASCLSSSTRSLTTPYGCCSDYMMVMLNDVTRWLQQENIPYFITYGTLLGAVREHDILPWTQDMDIVVDRSHWPQLQRGLEAAEFFGGRRYLFGVDQWEEKVSRVCADWEGFATSIIGGQEGDRFSRPTDFHLDVYASDWWQITDLHLADCVEPLGTLEIRGQNFSAPARPRACVEKLYGMEWRIPKKALAGVN